MLKLLPCLALASLTPALQAQVQVTERVSVATGGVQSSGNSDGAAISSDGRFVAFRGVSDDLAVGDSNGQEDTFIHDRVTGVTELVSVDSAGQQGDGFSYSPSLSSDGRYVAFQSSATNLVPGDTNGTWDVFVRDRQLGLTERVSVGLAGASPDNGCFTPSVSADGNLVAYYSIATNLVSGDSNAQRDIFVYDRTTGQTERVSLGPGGVEANGLCSSPRISADGQVVAFMSLASNLVAGDGNGQFDVFVHDRGTGVTERVSVDSSGLEADGASTELAISSDGRFVAFTSSATNLVPGDTNGQKDAFVRDRLLGTTELVSVDSYGAQGTGFSRVGDISADGRLVSFVSAAKDLVPGDTNNQMDVFVHDRQTGITERVSISSSAVQAIDHCAEGALSSDGRLVAFSTRSQNLTPGDSNLAYDVFVHDRRTGGPELNLTNVVSGQLASFTITGATPSSFVFVGFSLNNQGPQPTNWGPIEVGAPFGILPLPTDASGDVSLPIGIPPGITGLPLWVQGVDLLADYPTTPWGGLIQ